MNYSRLPPFAAPPLPRYPSLVDEGEAITLTMPARRLRIAHGSIDPRPSRRARHLPILYGAAAAASVVLGVVLWLVAASSGTDRDARAQEHEVTPTARTRVAAEQNVEELPVIRAEDRPLVAPSIEERPAHAPEAPLARRSRR